MKLFLFLLGVLLAASASALPAYYTGQYYTHSATYNTGYGYGWDRTVVLDGYASHSTGYVSHGPYRCIGNGCGTYGYGRYTGPYNYGPEAPYQGRIGPYVNSNTYPFGLSGSCSGYWRGGCEWVHW